MRKRYRACLHRDDLAREPTRNPERNRTIAPNMREPRGSRNLPQSDCRQPGALPYSRLDIGKAEPGGTWAIGPQDLLEARGQNRQRVAGREPLTHSIKNNYVEK